MWTREEADRDVCETVHGEGDGERAGCGLRSVFHFVADVEKEFLGSNGEAYGGEGAHFGEGVFGVFV